MISLLDNAPHDFILNHSEEDLKPLLNFVHRTFNGYDFIQFVKSLQHIYLNHNGLEGVFEKHSTSTSTQPAISEFKKIFFEIEHLERTKKHIGDPLKKSAAKRINMWLRWMIRKDNNGVDFGIWKNISPSILSCPLDVHSGNIARQYNLLTRDKNDSKALEELDFNLRKLDANDPVKYDFALFGLGAIK